MSIEHCLAYIQKAQEKDGGFAHTAHHDTKHTTFITSLILLALAPLRSHSAAQSVTKKGVSFLKKERTDRWSWNYTQKKYQTSPRYPDDFDDTCSALAALSIHDHDYVDGGALASLAQLLIEYETHEGGPYSTWMVPGSAQKGAAWHDVDVVVNSVIAYCLGLHSVSLPRLSTFIETCIKEKKYPSAYYTDPIICLYFISRAYKGPFAQKAISQILKRRKKNGCWDNPLLSALAVSALIRFGAPVKETKKAVSHLSQCSDFDGYPLYVEEKKNGAIYSESSALTAAYIAEACTLYKSIEKTAEEHTRADPREQHIHKEIIKRLTKKTREASPLFVPIQKQIISRILTSDKGSHITLLPYHVYKNLNHKRRKDIPTETLILLGYANLCGWIAYRIYDDILDEEGGSDTLSYANVCLREVVSTYLSILPKGEHSFFEHIMNTIDTANQWERTHCVIKKDQTTHISPHNLPRYTNHHVLADKSLGHILGPATIFILQGIKSNSAPLTHMIESMRSYLIARQMNDDAHDWFTDFSKGFYNSANTRLFLYMHSEQKKSSRHIPYTQKELQPLYWKHIIPDVVKDMTLQIQRAQKYAEKISHLIDPTYIHSLLLPIERSAEKALQERARIQKFISTYSADM